MTSVELYWANTTRSTVPAELERIIESFQHYIEWKGTTMPRDELLHRLDVRLADPGFCSDMQPLLRTGLAYDPQLAGKHVQEQLLMLLPE